MEQRKRKRYYKNGETVWVKSEKALGKIKELNIKPEEQVYEALVEIIEGEQKGATLKLNLWEIDKNKRKPKKVAAKGQKIPTILFAKVRPTAIIPSKEAEDAGYDIYADFEESFIRIEPHETKLIPTGIAASVLSDWCLIVKERGSTGSKGMAVRAGVVDSSYRGEIFVALTNENNKPLYITKDYSEVIEGGEGIVYPASKAIAQLLLVAVPKAKTKEITYEQLQAIPSKRGTGMLGSSGK